MLGTSSAQSIHVQLIRVKIVSRELFLVFDANHSYVFKQELSRYLYKISCVSDFLTAPIIYSLCMKF